MRRTALILSDSVPTPPRPPAFALEAPRAATAMILGRMAPWFLHPERRLCVVDGGNAFDPYQFSLEARRRGLREDVLDRVFVTRTFTIHQVAAVTEEMLVPLVRADDPPMVAFLGLDHLFRDETLRAAERARVLGLVMQDLERLRRDGVRLLVTHDRPPRGQGWWQALARFGDVRGRALRTGKHDWRIQIERTDNGTHDSDLQFLAAD